jgi:hypothetical protein
MERLHRWHNFNSYEKILIFLFLLSLPLVNPWVRGDGVGYYAYARALVVNHNLRFESDWLHSNTSFFMHRVNGKGEILPEEYTATGYLDNHFSIGPAIDWMPFLLVTHWAVRGFDSLGGRIPADGFSWPYMITMAVVSAFAGFLGLYFSFLLARKYVSEGWAFLATIGIWFAGSIAIYMYFNPSWSHAHSAFVAALFFWYWDRTRGTRALSQWIILGLISALMVNMYYMNAVLLLAPALEVLWLFRKSLGEAAAERKAMYFSLFGRLSAFALVLVLGLLPTLISRKIIYGSAFATGYFPLHSWNWTSPVLWKVLFSSDHGLFSWTPILLLAALGLIPFFRREKELAIVFLSCFLVFYYAIASYPDWDGISSFGNRFFISLTPIFVVGLAAFFAGFEKLWRDRQAARTRAWIVTSLLIFWNIGFVYQWGMHLISERGEISWKEMVYNQFRVVPEDMAGSVEQYFTHRTQMMNGIEKQDLKQLGEQETKPNEGPK